MTLSIQQRFFPDMRCFGCGPTNPKGLQLNSFEAMVDGAAVAVARFSPWPEHDNGFGFLNGGIISTVLDCHSAAAMVIDADRAGFVPEGTGLGYVTAGLNVTFRRPTPLTEELELRSQVLESSSTQITVHAEVIWDGKVRAEADSIWRRWRPR